MVKGVYEQVTMLWSRGSKVAVVRRMCELATQTSDRPIRRPGRGLHHRHGTLPPKKHPMVKDAPIDEFAMVSPLVASKIRL